MRELDRRLQRIEAELAGALAAQTADFWSAMPKHLTYGELLAGQQIIERYGNDCDAALAAREPGWLALCAAARARMAGLAVGELFPEHPAERSF
jgi:hypothetical protein